MNRRFSGDIRDLFKIDLVVHLMNEITALKRFTFVPMITGEDGTAEQGKRKKNLEAAVAKGRAGSRNA